MSRAVTLCALALTAVVSVGLYKLSYRVQAQEDTLLRLNRTLNRDHEAIWVLKAEWSYLTRPVALQQEADRFLALQPIQSGQIVTEAQVAALPLMIDFPPPDTTIPLPLVRPASPAPQNLRDVPVATRQTSPPRRRAARLAPAASGLAAGRLVPVLVSDETVRR